MCTYILKSVTKQAPRIQQKDRQERRAAELFTQLLCKTEIKSKQKNFYLNIF